VKGVVQLVRIVFFFANNQNHCRQCIFSFKHIILICQKAKKIFPCSAIYTFMCVIMIVHPFFKLYLLRNRCESAFYFSKGRNCDATNVLEVLST
jgi:hypothetical protein